MTLLSIGDSGIGGLWDRSSRPVNFFLERLCRFGHRSRDFDSTTSIRNGAETTTRKKQKKEEVIKSIY